MSIGDSNLGRGIGIGAACLGIGAGFALLVYTLGNSASRTDRFLEEKRIEAQVETQRLKTIEELVKQCGSKMSQEEFKEYLIDLNLYKEK